MHGIHDMGGMHGFGPMVVEANEPVFHATWEKRVLGMAYIVVGFGWTNVDRFRHAIERIDPVQYLSVGYYGRWLAALERICAETGLLAAGDIERRIDGQPITEPTTAPRPGEAGRGFIRALAQAPRFAVGDYVRPHVSSPAGHTRLPAYVAGRRGRIARVHPACIFPDTNAHDKGEDPQHLYSVRFEATELWGIDAEPGAAVHADLFEPYLLPDDARKSRKHKGVKARE